LIYRKHAAAIEIALIHVRHRWGLPKGHVEEGESIDETAVREVREETGLEGRVRKKLGDIRYSYREKRRGGEPVRIYKRVYFYLLRYIKGDVRDHDHEVEEARWFPISEAINVLKFATERRMVQRALAVLTAPDRQPARAASDEQR
jgi:8-oxo-dGTP pyrophosphatase MutT (NUDIX family)